MPQATKSVVPPPRQARSRAALERLLASAEHVLVHDGIEEFTIIRVAEHAGVSVGGVYRRFANKEQLIDAVREKLLTRLEDSITAALNGYHPSLAAVLALGLQTDVIGVPWLACVIWALAGSCVAVRNRVRPSER